MKPKFTIKKDDRIFIKENFYSNGHWIVKSKPFEKNKEFIKLKFLPEGKYYYGEKTSNTTYDVAEKWREIIAQEKTGVFLTNEIRWKNGEIIALILESEDKKISVGIAPNCFPLLENCKIFATKENILIGEIQGEPVVIIAGVKK